MKKQVIIIGGGEAFDTYKEYISFLKNLEIDLKRIKGKRWKDSMEKNLGKDFEVIQPQMPNRMNARYLEWKIYFERFFPLFKNNIILVGHSLGGIFLAKYLSENDFPKSIKAVMLVAAPYNTKKYHPLADFNLSLRGDLSRFELQAENIYLYQSQDDKVVPHYNVVKYKQNIPKARLKIFKDRKHFNQPKFPELVKDIRSLW